MARTLTRDNHKNAFGAVQDSLAGLTTSSGSHLVVIRQPNTWNKKQLVATPTEIVYKQGWSCGLELYPNVQGTVNVYNDTNTLLNNVKTAIGTSGWKVGDCALFSISSRAEGPYAWYNYYKHYDPTTPSVQRLSDYGMSVVAYKFNFHRLFISKMLPSSINIYVRVWAPSLLLSEPNMYPDDAIMIKGGLYNDASTLRVKLFEELPENPAWNLADDGDSFEFAGNCNNGVVVQQDTVTSDNAVSYNSFNGEMAYSSRGNSSRIYTIKQNGNPANFYHDFKITNTDNMNILKDNPTEFWVVAHFHMGNAFSQGTNTIYGLAPLHAATVFSERIELVAECTSTRFNV